MAALLEGNTYILYDISSFEGSVFMNGYVSVSFSQSTPWSGKYTESSFVFGKYVVNTYEMTWDLIGEDLSTIDIYWPENNKQLIDFSLTNETLTCIKEGKEVSFLREIEEDKSFVENGVSYFVENMTITPSTGKTRMLLFTPTILTLNFPEGKIRKMNSYTLSAGSYIEVDTNEKSYVYICSTKGEKYFYYVASTSPLELKGTDDKYYLYVGTFNPGSGVVEQIENGVVQMK